MARLRRGLNRRVAAAIAYRERKTRMSALYQFEGRGLDKARAYRGPLDEAFEKATQFRKRRRFG